MTETTNETSNAKPSKRQSIRKWILRLAVALAIITPIWFMLAALGSKWGLWDWTIGLGKMTFQMGPKLLMLTLAMGVVALLSTFMVKPRKGLGAAALAILVGAGGLFFAGSVKAKADRLPYIHDVTTDTQNPPNFTEAILTERAKTPNVNPVNYVGKMDPKGKELVSVLQTRGYPDVSTLVVADDTAVAFGEAKTAVKALGWKMVSEDLENGQIEATVETFWYGFKDDVVIRIVAAEGGGSRVDIRSVSRVGGSDLGANADRIRAFLDLMRAD